MSADPSHAVILASAGTGKTYALTNRYLALVLAGEEPSRILATTFARKAAGEILDRVLERLAEAALDRGKREELAAALGDDALTSGDCAAALAGLVKQLPRLAICTLDALFAKMASGFALDLEIPPGWSIVDEDVDRRLRDRAIGDVLASGKGRDLVTLIRLIARGDYSRSVHDLIDRSIDAMYAAYLESPAGAWDAIDPPAPLGVDELKRAIECLGRIDLPKTKAGSVNKSWSKARDKAVRAVNAKRWIELLDSGIAKKIINRETTFSRQEITTEVMSAYEPLIQHAAAIVLGKWVAQNHATRDLLARYDEHYRRLKQGMGALRFDDIPRLLLAAGVSGRLDELYYRLDGRYRHLLLDEFQDTSLVQWRLIEPIAEEIIAQGEDGSRTFFCVGDAKQSLFEWRDAAPALLPSIPKIWPQVERQLLTRSYRSSPIIIEAVNRVFESLESNPAFAGAPEAAEAARQWLGQFTPHTTALDTPGSVRLITSALADEGEKPVDAVIRRAADRVVDLTQAHPGQSVGVLVRVKKHIPRLIDALKGRGVIASEEGGAPLTDAPAVAVAMSALRLADHPGDTACRFHVAHSPLAEAVGLEPGAKLDAVCRVALRIRTELADVGHAATLTRWLDRIAPACHEREFRRFEQLIDLARRYDERATLRPIDFVAFVEQSKVEDPTSAPVRIMTIHAAKGLEFDAVVLPDLDGKLIGNADVFVYRGNPLGPIEAVGRAPNENLCKLDPLLTKMRRDHRVGQVREQLSVLYVALTRAQRRLEMVIAPDEHDTPPMTFAGVLRGALAPDVPADVDTVLWEIGGIEPAKEAPPPQPEPTPIVVKLSGPSRRRVHRSPSELARGEGAGGLVDPGRLLSIEGDSARVRGSVFHAWFEHVGWLEDGVPGDDELRNLADGFHVGDDLDRWIDEFRAMLNRPAVARLLRRDEYEIEADDELELWRERPFVVRDVDPDTGRSIVLNGRFDRLVITRRAGRAVVAHLIDFKTDAVASDEDIDAVTVAYTRQMRAYQRAAASLLGLERIRASLAYVRAGVVREV